MSASVPESELLSAYLDGELSEAERERVEQALSRSPELAQELASLRSLVQAVHALPAIKAPNHFADQVARRYRRDRRLQSGLLGIFVAMPFQVLSILLIAIVAAMYLSLAITHQYESFTPVQDSSKSVDKASPIDASR